MPDKNKLKLADEVGLHVARSCATCTHARWRSQVVGRLNWGYCGHEGATYEHLKHGPRRLPAHPMLACDRWEPCGPAWMTELGYYADLVRQPKTAAIAEAVGHLRSALQSASKHLPPTVRSVMKDVDEQMRRIEKMLREEF